MSKYIIEREPSMLIKHERTTDLVQVLYSNKIPVVKEDEHFLWLEVRDSDFAMYMVEVYRKLNWL